MSGVTDIDKLMYDCGIEVLHPGGLAKTDEMARSSRVGRGKRVLDIGGGRGTTACYLARNYGCKVVGIDVSPDMVVAASQRAEKEGLENVVGLLQADAHAMPFTDDSFDVVLIECVTTLLDRDKAFGELQRVLKPDGYLGDLEMIYQCQPSEALEQQLFNAWGGFTTMTIAGWQEYLHSRGMEVVEVDDFSAALNDIRWATVKEMGVSGTVRMALSLLMKPSLAMVFLEWDRIFRKAKGIIGYAYLVAKNARPSEERPSKTEA